MKTKELKGLSAQELDSKLSELVETHFNLRFQHRTGQLESTGRLKQVRRDIARVKTIQRDKELNSR